MSNEWLKRQTENPIFRKTPHSEVSGVAPDQHHAQIHAHSTHTGLDVDDHTQYIKHSLATAVSDFLVASGAGAFVKKTLDEVKTLLGIGAALVLADGTELTIAAGRIDITSSRHLVDTEGDAASDDLDLIMTGSEGRVLIISIASSARVVVVRHNVAGILLNSGKNLTLSDVADTLTLIYHSSYWREVAHSYNHSFAGVYMARIAVGTYTGNAGTNRAIPHGLGEVPKHVRINRDVFAASTHNSGELWGSYPGNLNYLSADAALTATMRNYGQTEMNSTNFYIGPVLNVNLALYSWYAIV